MKGMTKRKAIWVQGACALAMLILWSSNAIAQRRVYTNDDIPSAGMATEPETETTAPAAQPATTEPRQAAQPTAAETISAPPDEATRLNEFLITLGEISTDLGERIQASSDEVVTLRLTAHRESIDGVIMEYVEILSSVKAQQPKEQQTTPAQPATEPEAQQPSGTMP